MVVVMLFCGCVCSGLDIRYACMVRRVLWSLGKMDEAKGEAHRGKGTGAEPNGLVWFSR